ncbi:MAG TPA: MarR family transcriptional regulator [Woeseiaceae bacterium]|jgi:DNA-binding MarR family transcriptional regulator
MNAKAAAKQDFMPLMRELVRTYQAFAAYDAAGYRGTGLTVPQADVLFTLGDQDALTFKAIGEKSLITKGTLTGVVDRMEQKGLVRRVNCPVDRRCVRATLTEQGNSLFEREFPRQIAHMKSRFGRLSKAEQQQALESLRKLRSIF